MTDQEKQRLQEIEERNKARTQGQWEATDLGECDVHVTIDYKYENGIHKANWIATMDDDFEATTQEERLNNAEFIANAPDDIAFLLQQLRASLEREREKDERIDHMKRELDKYDDEIREMEEEIDELNDAMRGES